MITKNMPLKTVLQLAPPCKCQACNNGCKYGSGFLVEADLKPMADFLKLSVDELKEKYLEEAEQFNKMLFRPKLLRKGKKPYGKCIFFDRKTGCKVHIVKPLQCKVAMGCKGYGEELMLWFMLNHILDTDDPEAIRQYAQYLKAGGKTFQGSSLSDLVPEKEKLKKILNYEII